MTGKRLDLRSITAWDMDNKVSRVRTMCGYRVKHISFSISV